MSGFLQGQTTKANLPVKRFGYLISAVFLILSNISLYMKWAATPWLFLVTMYLLTGSLWAPVLIRPLYRILGKYWIKPDGEEQKQEGDKDTYFHKN